MGKLCTNWLRPEPITGKKVGPAMEASKEISPQNRVTTPE